MRNHTIHSQFRRVAFHYPSNTAVAYGSSTATYQELDAASDQIALRLYNAGVGGGDYVGLFAGRSIGSIAAILGVLKAGAAYVPFDISYPRNLLQFIYKDSAPRVMIAQRGLDGAFWDGPTLLFDAEKLPAGPAQQFTCPSLSADSLAYIMYTSGSTGRPKGVMVPHRGVTRLVIGSNFAKLGPDETILQLAPLSFDASTFEIWGALLNGGKLAVVSTAHPSLDQIADEIKASGATTLWLTAGLFHAMVDHRLDGLKPLRQLLAGGDVLSPIHVETVLREIPSCRLINGYGPTENTTFTCCYTIPPGAHRGPIPIGFPISQTQVYVLDENLQPVADGSEGELYAGGAGLALGYLNQPELSAEKFVPNLFDPTPGAQLYRTGDRVRRNAEGAYDFLGREDLQVKINGKRVELGEIENCIRRSGLAEDAAAIAVTLRRTRQLAVFCIPRPGQAVTPNDVRAHLRQELPDYMVPPSIILVDKLPLSHNGKVDRHKLAEVHEATVKAPLAVAMPSNSIGARLIEIWHEVLGTDAIGIDTNFFDLGGTSLQLLRVHAILQEAFGQSISIVDLFRHTTIRSLADCLNQRSVRECAAVNRQEGRNAALTRARGTYRRGASR
jgi:amino acid adenylation domain-containing protein